MTALTVTLTGPRFSANDRHHWARKAGLNQIWRDMAMVVTLAAIRANGWAPRVPMQRAHALVEVVPHNRGKVDPHNASPAGKACIDGFVRAGLLVDDDAAHLLGPDFRLADQPVRQQRGMWTLRITVTELDAPERGVIQNAGVSGLGDTGQGGFVALDGRGAPAIGIPGPTQNRRPGEEP